VLIVVSHIKHFLIFRQQLYNH